MKIILIVIALFFSVSAYADESIIDPEEGLSHYEKKLRSMNEIIRMEEANIRRMEESSESAQRASERIMGLTKEIEAINNPVTDEATIDHNNYVQSLDEEIKFYEEQIRIREEKAESNKEITERTAKLDRLKNKLEAMDNPTEERSTIDPETGFLDYDALLESMQNRLRMGEENLRRQEESIRSIKERSAAVQSLTKKVEDVSAENPTLLENSMKLSRQVREDERKAAKIKKFREENPDWRLLELGDAADKL